MLIVSAVGVGCCMVTLGGYLILRDHSQGLDLSSWNWIPLLSLSGAVFLDNFGVVSLPYVVVCEILPYEVRVMISLLTNFNVINVILINMSFISVAKCYQWSISNNYLVNIILFIKIFSICC